MFVAIDNARALDSAPLFVPRVPETLSDTGLTASLIEHLIFNMLYGRGEMKGKNLADSLGLRFSVLDPILNELKARQLIEIKSSLGFGMISSVFALTESARKQHMANSGASQYTGPAPVTLEQYCQSVAAQKPRKGWLTKATLAQAYCHMEVGPEVLRQLGPAINSGRSLLIFGQPGNGKTYLAEALAELSGAEVYMPYAIEHNGAIVRLFDPLYHRPTDLATDSESLFSLQRSYDSRWVRCRRPFIASGGELSSEALELSYNVETKTLDSPIHLKANNGIYLIDDFGRQRITPAELLNRWIVPMESRVDQLALPFGGNISIPFEVMLIFSSNLNPSDLGDEAFLRRIQYKMLVSNPSVEEFRRIFQSFCRAKGLTCDDTLLEHFIERHYVRTAKLFRRCHPRDIVSHAIDLMEFEGLPYELTEPLLDDAFASCFAQ